MTDWTALVEEHGRWRALDVADGAITAHRHGPAPRPLLSDSPTVVAAASAGLEPRALPCAPAPNTWPRAEIAGRALPALPSLSQPRPATPVTPPEAARIAGILVGLPQFDGVIWICGATALWAHISAQEVVSVTRAAPAATLAALGAPLTPGAEFDTALAEALSRPERSQRALAELALDGRSDWATGALLGAELAAARPWWLGQQVLALSSPTAPGWAEICMRGLQAQGAAVTLGDGEAALVAGLATGLA